MRLPFFPLVLAAVVGTAVMASDGLSSRDRMYAYDLTPRGVLEELSRRQTTNTTTTDDGSTGQGGTAVVSHDEPGEQSDCNMVNLLSQNQQASWTDTHVSTCCVGTLQSTCFLRIQTDVQGSDKCIIPNCDDLQSNDADKMVGFKPLTSTWAKGAHSNEYYFKTSAAAPNFHTVSMTMLASTAAVVALAMAGNAIFA